jgi:glycosyltransferase involved in cell wall biosynthesis
MRILIITAVYPPVAGGVADHAFDLNKTLGRIGHDVICLCGADSNKDMASSDGTNIFYRHALSPRSLSQPKSVKQADHREIGKLITNLSATCDILHCHNAHLYGSRLADLIFQQSGNIPLVNTVHDHLGDGLRPEVLNRTWDQLIYVSNFIRARLPSETPSVTLHLPIDLERFSPYGPVDSRLLALERPVIFHPARLISVKGIEVGLEAFICLRKRIGFGTLVLTDGGRSRNRESANNDLRQKIVRRASTSGVLENVIFYDMPHNDLAPAMRASDLVWYPSIGEESFGLTPLEAVACGIPVVVSNSGGMVEVAQAGIPSIVVPRGSSESLADAAYDLIRDEDARQRAITAATQNIANYGLDMYASNLVKVYSSIVARRSACRKSASHADGD